MSSKYLPFYHCSLTAQHHRRLHHRRIYTVVFVSFVTVVKFCLRASMLAYRDVYVLGNLSESVSCRHPRRLPYRQPRFCGVSLTSPSSRRIVLSFLCEFFRAVLFSMPLLWLLSPNNVVLFGTWLGILPVLYIGLFQTYGRCV